MPDKDPAGDEPSLELPSFGFGRRKRREHAEDAPPVVPEPQSQPEPEPEPAPTPDPDPDPDPEPEPEPVEQPTQVLPPAPPRERRTEPAPAVARPRAVARPPAVSRGAVVTEPREDVAEVEPAPAPARERREVRFPSLPALPAVLLVGTLVGLTAVLLTYGSLRLCDVATGTATCGGGPGLLLMLAILIALTYLGGWLLRGLGLPDAGSTSFLAVALLAVVAMLFLVDSLDEWSGAVAVVVVTVVAYAVSWRVTAALADAGTDRP